MTDFSALAFDPDDTDPIDAEPFETAAPDDPDLEGLAAEALPCEDPGPDGDLDMHADAKGL